MMSLSIVTPPQSAVSSSSSVCLSSGSETGSTYSDLIDAVSPPPSSHRGSRQHKYSHDTTTMSASASHTTGSGLSPTEDSDHKSRLEQLKSHPLFGDLQMTLALDCLQSNVPFTLMSDNANKSPVKSPADPTAAFCTVSDRIIEQHVKLQGMLLTVRSYFPSLLSVYQQITEQVESQRYKALTYNCYSDNVKQLINWFYDSERQLLIDRIQDTVNMLMTKTKTLLPDPTKLGFGLIPTLPPALSFAAASAPPPPHHQDMETERPLDLSGPQARKSSTEQPLPEKKSRFLSKKAVAILQHWYQKHRDHPYATDDEVKELALAGGIAPNQVKKWMANTRARSYNTLTYNGGKHMLNSKIAMKKRLLHKYRIEPTNTSSSRFYSEEKSRDRNLLSSSSSNSELSQRRPTLVDNSSITVQPVQSAVFPSEEVKEEQIDVETITESPAPAQNIEEIDVSEETPATSGKSRSDTPPVQSSKPSLEQVVARCRLKSNEVSKETSVEGSNSKSALESLREVVNSVTTADDERSPSPSTPLDEDRASNIDTESDNNSTLASKRYLSSHAKTILNEWFRKHLYRPYPTYEEKKELASLCGISASKVDTWFANKRNRTHNTKKLPPKYSHLFSFSGVNSD